MHKKSEGSVQSIAGQAILNGVPQSTSLKLDKNFSKNKDGKLFRLSQTSLATANFVKVFRRAQIAKSVSQMPGPGAYDY